MAPLERSIDLLGGGSIPAFGLGTWRMGESSTTRKSEVAALRAGLDLGVRLIDTAEMYGDGGAEEVVAEAIGAARDQVFIVSKVYPHNASRQGTIAACERSLRRLKTDRIDLYLLHWRGGVPLTETVAAFDVLQRGGKIRHWGVSNFDSSDMSELAAIEAVSPCATNQVLYHPGERGIEWKLLGDSVRAGIPVMAYSPLGQGSLLDNPALVQIAAKHGVAPATVAVAWTLRSCTVVSIPKTAHASQVGDLVAGARIMLDGNDCATIDRAFPAPRGARPLAML